jgi:hypothetical protein
MRRNVKKEQLAIDYEKAGESVCGVTFDEVRKEAMQMLATPGFLPQCYDREHVVESELVQTMVELTAFAAMNVIRRHNGMPELVDL